ncbi:FLYWCH family member [Marssonina coronariae]|uniref:FLYWCH family member n=1 Tax=Diplocarpon coronariae TaxID=2795749 RepID=A0A218Z8S0_9HELO|nr:FLYWCH family member [Marssonina coronariae]
MHPPVDIQTTGETTTTAALFTTTYQAERAIRGALQAPRPRTSPDAKETRKKSNAREDARESPAGPSRRQEISSLRPVYRTTCFAYAQAKQTPPESRIEPPQTHSALPMTRSGVPRACDEQLPSAAITLACDIRLWRITTSIKNFGTERQPVRRWGCHVGYESINVGAHKTIGRRAMTSLRSLEPALSTRLQAAECVAALRSEKFTLGLP